MKTTINLSLLAIELLLFTLLVSSLAGKARGEDGKCLQTLIEATVRITAANGSRGSGTVFDESKDSYLILTNAHVAGRRNSTVQIEFWRKGYQGKSVRGAVIRSWLGRLEASEYRDIAVVAVPKAAVGKVPVVPLCARDYQLKSRTIHSAGAARGGWPTAWRGYLSGEAATSTWNFYPSPVGGRSGSAIFDRDCKNIIGLIAWNASGVGRAMHWKEIYRAFDNKPIIRQVNRDGRRWRPVVTWQDAPGLAWMPGTCVHGVSLAAPCQFCGPDGCGPGTPPSGGGLWLGGGRFRFGQGGGYNGGGQQPLPPGGNGGSDGDGGGFTGPNGDPYSPWNNGNPDLGNPPSTNPPSTNPPSTSPPATQGPVDYDKILSLMAKDDRFRGPPGKDGRDGLDGAPGEVSEGHLQNVIRSIQKYIDEDPEKFRGPAGKDGANGVVDYERLKTEIMPEVDIRLDALRQEILARLNNQPAKATGILYFTASNCEHCADTDALARRLKSNGANITIITLKPKEVSVDEIPRLFNLETKRETKGANEVKQVLGGL